MNNSDQEKATEDRVAAVLNARSELLAEPFSTCVVVPDATRPISYEQTVGPLVSQLAEAGSSVEIVVGMGLHRPMTPQELQPLREAIGDRNVEIFQHDASGEALVELGDAGELPETAPERIPVALNRRVVEAQRVVCVGVVEPHQYAGFSGGIKAVSIGCASRETISAMHGLSFLRDQRTTLGRVEDNPFQQALWRIGAALENVLGLQIIPGQGGGVSQVIFDEVDPAFETACRRARAQFFEPIGDGPVDWVHLPVPEVKASNFYQASRAATYVALVDQPAVRESGVIIVEARCPEGVGVGRGERRCAEAMQRGVDALLEELESSRDVETTGGQQRAYVLAKTCNRNRVVLVGAPPIEALRSMGIEQFAAVDEVFDRYELDPEAGLRIDDVFHRVPYLQR